PRPPPRARGEARVGRAAATPGHPRAAPGHRSPTAVATRGTESPRRAARPDTPAPGTAPDREAKGRPAAPAGARPGATPAPRIPATPGHRTPVLLVSERST